MKKIILPFLMMCFFATTQAQTVDEILAKYEAAVGGRETLEKIKTLQYKSVVTLKMMGNPFDVAVTNYRENNKLYRRETQGMMGMRGSYSLLTDTAGYLFVPQMPNFGGGGGFGEGGGGGGFGGGRGFGGGNAGTLTKNTNDELAEQLYQLDCAGAFGHLVNYAAKGHKAELVGTTKINKQECYKIKFTLKSGQEITYFINATTYLIVEADCIGKIAIQQFGIGPLMEQMGSDRAKRMKVSILYSDYQEVGGIKFPMKEKLEVGAAEIDLVNSDFIVNVEIDAKYYKVKN
jgi:hypothetical protein